MQDFIEGVRKWASDKGIYSGSTLEKQGQVFIEELGEFNGAMLKQNQEAAIMELGDVLVTIVNCFTMGNFKIASCDFDTLAFEDDSYLTLYRASCSLVEAVNKGDAAVAGVCLRYMALQANTTLYNAGMTALRKIQGRQTKMVAGKAIKIEDLQIT